MNCSLLTTVGKVGVGATVLVCVGRRVCVCVCVEWTCVRVWTGEVDLYCVTSWVTESEITAGHWPFSEHFE